MYSYLFIPLGGEIKAADIGIILDGSRDVKEGNLKRQLELVKLIIQSFRVSQEEVHFGIAVTTLKPEVVIQLDEYTDSATLQAGVDKLSYPAGRRNTGAAIKLAQDQLFTKARAGIPRVLIIFVGGKLKDNTIEPAEAIKKTGTKLVVIGIRKKVNPVVKQLKSIASKPDFVIIQQYVIYITAIIAPLVDKINEGNLWDHQNMLFLCFFIVPTVKIKENLVSPTVVAPREGGGGGHSHPVGSPSLIDSSGKTKKKICRNSEKHDLVAMFVLPHVIILMNNLR